jgi:hypothetical protein
MSTWPRSSHTQNSDSHKHFFVAGSAEKVKGASKASRGSAAAGGGEGAGMMSFVESDMRNL